MALFLKSCLKWSKVSIMICPIKTIDKVLKESAMARLPDDEIAKLKEQVSLLRLV